MGRNYRLYGADEPVSATIEGTGEDTYRVALDEVVHDVTLRLISNTMILLQFADGRNIEVPFYRDGSQVAVEIGGRSYSYQVLDQMQAVLKERGPGAAGSDGAVTVAMPGRVIKLLVGEGDHVEAGDGVIIVEAMKMENELKAPVSGTIAKINVAVGDTVESGNLLAQIDPDA